MGKFIWSSLLLVLSFLSIFDCSSLSPTTPLCLPEDSSSLLQFKNTISIDDSYEVSCDYETSYPKTNSWNESTNCCTWDGVTCHKATGRVIGLDLSCSKLVGSLSPNTTLSRLQGLKRLNLSHNDFNGSLIPSGFSQLVSLTHLNLSSSSFSGLVPSNISLLSKLISLDLSSNDLKFESHSFGMLTSNLSKLENLFLDSVNMSDVVPTTSFINLSSSLKHLSLSSCNLQGELPGKIFQLWNLEYLDLSKNSLTGFRTKSNWGSPLWLLDLSSNQLRGPIPESLGNLTKITSLDFSENAFEGQIPDVFGNLDKLTYLNLSSNRLDGPLPTQITGLQNLVELRLGDNLLSGAIPSWLFTLPSLQILYLNRNSLTGPIDQQPNFTGFNSLSDVDLSNNLIQGSISKWELQVWEHVTSLNLSHNLLTSLEQFPEVRVLDLSHNQLQGPLSAPLPPSLEELWISNNSLTGEIPPSICNLTSLEILDLSKNHFGGMIPACLGTLSKDLTTVNLQANNFSGKIPDFCVDHPNSFVNIALNNNQLEGLLPRSLIDCTRLEFLNVANNKLSDTFPHWLGALTDLQVLILRFNRFHGPLNISKPSFSSLQIVDLSGNEFTGLLPTVFFRNLDALKDTIISQNRSDYIYRGLYTGPYSGPYSRPYSGPYSHDRYAKSGYSQLGCSRFGGQKQRPSYRKNRPSYRKNHIDGQISVNVTSKKSEMELQHMRALLLFAVIDFSNNRFSGKIPQAIGELRGIEVLNLSHNGFTGPIPSSFGNLVALESLDLSSNNLSGRIPSQLTNLTFLAVLNFSQNNLVGPIPHGNQFNTFQNDSYYGNLGLCGFPLTEQCGNGERPKPPAPKLKEDEGSPVPFFWNLVMMGYGCGVVLGVSTAYIVFTTGRPWWFVRMVERDWQRNVTRWICRIRGKRNIH